MSNWTAGDSLIASMHKQTLRAAGWDADDELPYPYNDPDEWPNGFKDDRGTFYVTGEADDEWMIAERTWGEL